MSESGKVVVTKSKLDELANSINNKAKSPGPKTIAQLTQTVNDMQTGGSSVFLVTLSRDAVGQATADKSFTEIFTAYNNGNIVRAKWDEWILDLVYIANEMLVFAVCTNNNVDNASMLISVTAQCIPGEPDVWALGIGPHNTPRPSGSIPEAPGAATPGQSKDYAHGDHVHPKELPIVTATDNGKFLRVVSGEWKAVEIANANGVSF